MTDLTDEAVKALADAKPGNLFVDQDEDVCIDDGRQFNLIFCPARDDGPIEAGWAVLNPDVVAELVTRYNMAPDLARALLAARAELAQARADAKAAQALVVERFRHDLQFMVDSIAEDKAYVADKYPALFKTIQARLAEMGTFGGVQVFGEIARDLLVLADADGLAAVEALRVEARENAMQALASMWQAQEAYEAQLEAEAELARVKADAAAAVALVVSELRQFVTDSYQCGCMDAGCAGRHAERNSTLEALSETLDALADADGLAAVEALRERAEKAEAERDELKREGRPADHRLVDKYRDPKTGVFKFPDDVAAIVRHLDAAEAERDRLAAANAVLEAKVAGLRAAFRVNMLRFGPPGTSHEEIDAAIDAALASGKPGEAGNG